MNLRLLWLPLLLAAAAASVAAEPPPTRQLSLQECIELALRHNLDLRIERYSPQLALYDLNAVRSAYEPTFSVSGSHDYNQAGSRLLAGGFSIPGSESEADSFSMALGGLTPWGMTYSLQGNVSDTYGSTPTLINDPSKAYVVTNSFVDPITGNTISALTTNYGQMVVDRPFENSRGAASVNLTQPLLKDFWIDSTRLSIQLARTRLKSSDLGLQQRIMATVNEVEQAYYNLIYAREAVKVQEKAVELAERSVAENKKRVEVGAMAPLDEQQAEAQAASSRADLLSARNELAITENALKRLLTDDFAAWSRVPLEVTGTLETERQFFDRQESWNRGLSLRPEYQQLKVELERIGIQLKYDQNQLYPQLDLFGSYGLGGSSYEYSGAFDNMANADQPFYNFGGRLSLPLGNGAARNRVKSTKAQREQALLMLKRLEQGIMIEIDNAIKIAQSNFERVQATRQATEFAQAALDAEQKKLENGKSTSFVVLRLQRDLTTVSSDEIRARTVYLKSLAQLAFYEGYTLQRHRIDLQPVP